jgi:hyaluronate lyase
VTGVLRNGRPWSTLGQADLTWLRYANTTAGTSLGYYFLQPAPIAVGLEQVTRSRRTIRTANPDTQVTKQIFTLTHETRRRASLAYALIPHATEAALRSYRGRVHLLSNTPRLQAIHHPALNLTAANTFTPGRHHFLNYTIDGPASFLTQHRAGTTTIAISDPTTTRSTITVTVLGRWLTKLTADPGIELQHTLAGTRLTYSTHQTHGRTLTATFLR